MLLMHSGRSIFGNQMPMQFLEVRWSFAREDGCRRIGSVLESRMISINSVLHRMPPLIHTGAGNDALGAGSA